MAKSLIVQPLFWFVSALHVLGLVFENELLRLITKPFIILLLIVLYLASINERSKLYILALVFSFLGDVLLMWSGEIFFILGLISFLLAHLTFIKIITSKIKKTTIKSLLKSIIPFGVFLVLLQSVLFPHLDEMKIPVIIYGTVISIFGITASIRCLEQRNKQTLLLLIGAIVFAISDSVLAINKFYYSAHFLEITVMITYILAQYLIFRSMIFKKNN